MQRFIKKDSTDQTIDVFIMDSSSSTGAGLTGLAFNTASLTCYYRRGATGSATQLALATQTVGGAHSDGGFKEIDATNMPGWYRLDLSDAMVATGVPWVDIQLKGATNMAPCNVVVQLEAAPADITHLNGSSASALSSGVATGMAEFFDTHKQWTVGTVGATITSASVFQVDIALDTAANSHKYQELTLIRASGVRERQRIASHTRVDANTINVTLSNALTAVPTASDKVVMV